MIVKGELQDLHPATAERLIKHTHQIKQLFNLHNVQRLDKQNALVRRLVKKTQDGTLGQPTSADEEDADVAEDSEDDKVQFGDNVVNYTSTEPAQQVAAKLPSLLPYVLAAALGGGGLGAAATALPLLLKPQEPPKVITTDTDTLYDLRFKED